MIRVLGVPQVLARFARAAVLGELAANAGADALKVEVSETARSLAPVETGALAASITPTESGVAAGVDYAVFVEYGTSDTSAQPFLRPAVDEAKGEQAAIAAAAIMRKA